MGDVSRDYEQHVERRARAMCDGDPDTLIDIDGIGKVAAWVFWVLKARAAMEADRAAGYALCPREATEGMTQKARGKFISATNTRAPSHQLTERSLNAAISEGDILKGDGK